MIFILSWSDFNPFFNFFISLLQAIVFANDEMAFAGYRVCEKRGLKVGKDILITGFDDCERASGMEPPLTAIRPMRTPSC